MPGAAHETRLHSEAAPRSRTFRRRRRSSSGRPASCCVAMADADASEVYAGTAPTEVVCATLIRAAREGWSVGVLDITSAFLQTPLKAIADAPVVVASPPRILERQGLVEPKMLWGITHALYGLRQSPKLWGSFRDAIVKGLVVELDGVPHRLRQGKVENTWWVLKADSQDQIRAILVIYVDDFMIVREERTLRTTWPLKKMLSDI